MTIKYRSAFAATAIPSMAAALVKGLRVIVAIQLSVCVSVNIAMKSLIGASVQKALQRMMAVVIQQKPRGKEFHIISLVGQ